MLFCAFSSFFISMKLFFTNRFRSLFKVLGLSIFLMVWSSLMIGYWHEHSANILSPWYLIPGVLSMQIATYLGNLIRGLLLLLMTSLISMVIVLVASSSRSEGKAHSESTISSKEVEVSPFSCETPSFPSETQSDSPGKSFQEELSNLRILLQHKEE